MSIFEILLLGIGLSMDAFAVSVCKGLSVGRMRVSHVMLAGLYFGGFQALMPLVGYWLGSRFQAYIASFDHWIAFVLLALIGINMIREANQEEGESDASFSFGTMIPLAVATSIDALAVGITFSFLRVNIFLAVLLIGCTTFILSAAGVKIGNVFGLRYRKKAEIGGGVILILLGLKILLEHLGIGGLA